MSVDKHKKIKKENSRTSTKKQFPRVIISTETNSIHPDFVDQKVHSKQKIGPVKRQGSSCLWTTQLIGRWFGDCESGNENKRRFDCSGGHGSLEVNRHL